MIEDFYFGIDAPRGTPDDVLDFAGDVLAEAKYAAERVLLMKMPRGVTVVTKNHYGHYIELNEGGSK